VVPNGDNLFFTGPAAEAVYGGPVPVTYGLPNHIGNRAPRPGPDLIPDLVNGVVFLHGKRYFISNLDFAVVKDVGIPVRAPATVVGRQVFYNHSSFDGKDAAPNGADDAAIAPDKNALVAGSDRLPGFDNVTSFSKGLNGVMVDIAGLPQDRALTAADFEFRSGPDLSHLSPGPSFVQVSVRRGAGALGSDRVTITWSDYDPNVLPLVPVAVANGWLSATVEANANTGLAQPDVFSFGNLIGETGDGGGVVGWRVSALDLGRVKRDLNAVAALTSPTDANRDGRVNALDLGILKRNLNRGLSLPVDTSAPRLFARHDVAPVPDRAADEIL
jgi:hypothetical protein